MQYAQKGENQWIVQYRENTVLFLCILPSGIWTKICEFEEKTYIQLGELSDNYNCEVFVKILRYPLTFFIFFLNHFLPHSKKIRHPYQGHLTHSVCYIQPVPLLPH